MVGREEQAPSRSKRKIGDQARRNLGHMLHMVRLEEVRGIRPRLSRPFAARLRMAISAGKPQISFNNCQAGTSYE
jgi:hypothetical protein